MFVRHSKIGHSTSVEGHERRFMLRLVTSGSALSSDISQTGPVCHDGPTGDIFQARIHVLTTGDAEDRPQAADVQAAL